ncbi:MAG: NADH-quinone oxidoreductase subunit J [Phycisphaerales bacterium]
MYFILTILATAGLLLILSAEFMAFALVIIYAGAILITYLFVIMLATARRPRATRTCWRSTTVDAANLDRVSRQFVMLAVLTTMAFRAWRAGPGGGEGKPAIAELPRKVMRAPGRGDDRRG